MVLKNIVSTVKLAKTFGLPIVHLSTGFESIFRDVLYPTVKKTLTGQLK